MNILETITNLLKRDRPQGNRTSQRRRQAGVLVTEDSALTYSAVWACVRIISESIAALPWRAHRSTGQGNEILDGSDLDYILHVQANPEMSAFTFRETLLAHALTWGNGYAEIERTNGGNAWNLWPIMPDTITPDRDKSGRVVYVVNGQPVLSANDVFHVKGLGFDGLSGYSVINQAAKSIGLGMGLDSMANDTFANGATPGGVIIQKEGKSLSPEAARNLLNEWENRFKGPANANKIAYIDAGMDYKTVGLPMADLQFLESRKFQISEVARWYRVQPHKLADLEHATFSNIEHMALEFVTDTLIPWITRLETEAQIKLIGRNNRAGKIYTKINVKGLLRGDLPSRYSAYATGRQWGWLSVNDIRALEDMNPVSGGDDYLAPLNMAPADMLREINEPKEDAADITQPETNDTGAPDSVDNTELD